MVRKPELVPRPLSQAQNNPPYPTTPPDEHPPPFLHDPQASEANGYQFVTHEDASDISSSSDWDEPEDDDEDAKKDEIPAALRPGGHRPTSSQQAKPDELPSLLRRLPNVMVQMPPVHFILPPRPGNVNGAGAAGAAEQEQQRKENYSIKHIRWFDSHTDNLREAPVLTQNANGPCPLLALVNALVLSTPVRQQSTLVDALKTRETISLGLLLDAVFDELMSGQRGSAAQALPDVGDLYAFLLALHTGMNVNPRFVAPDSESLIDHPITQSPNKPGGFEQTREMRLYSTFNIPLIHGWMPSSDSAAYAAFNRSAKTYEDAQNIQFHEEELEVKLSSSGLSPEEQNLYEDLHVIKEFLQSWSTQLTDHGLKVIRDNLKPGQFAILFRNDHFSTIYKEPRSQKILTLVTDTGYSSHEEIVWESLVDITGRGSELFSGDFRPVSHSTGAAPERPIRSLLDDEPPHQPWGHSWKPA
ncbi:putative duf544 domain protein [Neofusicoccum parvum UCRNP2]|uniref:Uncharacterized protein LTHEOB_3798 n=2 Tax=Neofusicoccum parvum TaxID=310453 RepID=A0ACB5RQQ0_9PEZI|nr:putative duf544 domain protein [Neofusicoccum parvum UCRNP2]GME22847.1 uncharacterized protein LTHEOB_3798 [Neofusicoccum parvum]